MLEITGPDGTVIQFPADTPEEEIARVFDELAANGPIGGAPMGAPEEPKAGLMERAANWATGSSRDPNIGDARTLNLPTDQAAKLTALLATTMRPERLQEGIKQINPNATFEQDDAGTLVVHWPDAQGRVQRFYPNPSGPDLGDVMRGAGAVSAATGAGKLLTTVGLPVAGYLGAGLVGGTTAAITEGSSAAASGTGFRPSEVGWGIAGGVASEGLTRAAGALWRAASKRGADQVFDATGALKPEYARIAREAGLDPDDLNADVVARMANATRAGADPKAAGVAAMAGELNPPVPMTKGQISGSGGQQLAENRMMMGAEGKTAENIMRGQQAAQQQAIGDNMDRILRGLNPDAAPIARGQGGAAAQEALVGSRAAAKTQAAGLYDAARGSNAEVMPEAVATMSNRLREAYLPISDPVITPKVAAMIGKFDEAAAGGRVNGMFDWRQRMTSIASGNDSEAAVARQIIQAFDDDVPEAIKLALLQGDDQAAAMWGAAIDNYKDFARTWKSKGGILSTLTDTVTRDGAAPVLKVAPEAAADMIVSTTTAGLANKTGLARDLVTLRSWLPAGEWNQIRQEAYLRLMDTSRGAMRGGESQISGVNFKKAWDNLLNRNAGVVNALFSKSERAGISQLANVAAKATGSAVNSSNSANSALGAGLKLLQRIPAARILTEIPGSGIVSNALGAAKAVGATNGSMPTVMPTAFDNIRRGAAGLAAGANSELIKERISTGTNSLLGLIGR